MLIVRPWCGLCNRLRTMGSAIKLAKDIQVGLRIEWFRSPIRRWASRCGMRVRFSDLFMPIEGVVVKEKIHIRNDFPWNWLRYSKMNPRFYACAQRFEFVSDSKLCPLKKRWLWDWNNFYENSDYSWLQPQSIIKEKVMSFSDKVSSVRCVGLHIRRSDNLQAKIASPLSLFLEKIDYEIDSYGDTHFFLSTDDETTREYMLKRYGDRIITRKDIGDRYTLRGEVDAVADLLLLSQTSKIYGSYWSSFSEVAAAIGHVPLEILCRSDVNKEPWALC